LTKKEITKHKIVQREEAGQRVDRLVADWVDRLSRNKAQGLIEEGRVTVAGRRIKSSYRIDAGEEVKIEIPPLSEEDDRLKPQEMPLDVLYEDEYLAVIDKPTSLVVHPAPGHPDGTLVNALLNRYGSLPAPEDPIRPGIVHRLDKDTSGVILIARREKAYFDLTAQFKEREVEKEYLALVEGTFSENEGLIDAPIGRDRSDKTKRAVRLGGKEAKTRFFVESEFPTATLLKVKPLTGRTHQIRVHLKYIGHKILGDNYYGGRQCKRLMLHANEIAFRHPGSGEQVRFQAPLPPEFHQPESVLGSS